MSNKNKLYRSGCTPRVIFYSQTSKGHEYNYGNPIVTISGRNSRHIIQNTSNERKLLDYIRPHPQPNSNRTIIPNCENIDDKTVKNKNTKINYGTMDNKFCEIKNNNQKSSIKISRSKNKTSSDLLSNFREEEKVFDNNNSKSKTKNNYSYYIKNKYDYSSEIINLPGGNKRQFNDINDDFIIDPSSKKKNMNSTANCFRQRNINPSKNDFISHDVNKKINRPYSISKLKTDYENSKKGEKYNNFTNLINSSNIVFYNNNGDSRQNTLNNLSNDITINYNKEKDYINNKENYYTDNSNNITLNNYKTNEDMNFRKSRERIVQKYKNEMNNNKSFHFYQPINNNKLFPNYYEKVYKEKNNSLVTPYTKIKNINFHNQLFNEIHQQDNNYSLLNYYGKNYSKKNYSQIELH